MGSEWIISLIVVGVLVYCIIDVFLYLQIQPFLISAMRKKKIFKSLFLILLLGPPTWITMIIQYFPTFFILFTMWVLQEVPDRLREDKNVPQH